MLHQLGSFSHSCSMWFLLLETCRWYNWSNSEAWTSRKDVFWLTQDQDRRYERPYPQKWLRVSLERNTESRLSSFLRIQSGPCCPLNASQLWIARLALTLALRARCTYCWYWPPKEPPWARLWMNLLVEAPPDIQQPPPWGWFQPHLLWPWEPSTFLTTRSGCLDR